MRPYFRDEGEGEPLLLVHGLGSSSRAFEALFELRGSQRLIAIDLPRHDRSGAWAASDPRAIAIGLQAFLAERKVERLQVFGHSFGGLVALELARAMPQQLQALWLASVPAMGLPSELKLLLALPAADLTMSWWGRLPVFRPALRAYLSLIWGTTAPLTDARLAAFEAAQQADGFHQGMLECLRGVGAFQLPGLQGAPFERRCLWGERDRLVSPVDGERLARAIGASLRVLDGVGHCVPEEAPEALAAFLGLR